MLQVGMAFKSLRLMRHCLTLASRFKEPQVIMCQRCLHKPGIQGGGGTQFTKERLRKSRRKEARIVPRPVSEALHRDLVHCHGTADTIFIPSRNADRKTEQSALNLVSELQNMKITAAKEKIGSLTHKELRDILVVMATKHSTRNEQVLQLLQNECSLRVKDWNVTDMLFTADIIHALDVQRRTFFTQMLLEIEQRWDDLSLNKLQVLQTLFYGSLCRGAPKYLMLSIEKWLENTDEQLQPQEIGLVCHSFFVTNNAIKSIKLLDRISNQTLAKFDSISTVALTNVLKVMRHANYDKISFYEELGYVLSKSRIQEIRNFTSLMHIVVAYASVKVFHKELLDAALRQAVHLIQQGDKFLRLKEFGRFLWAVSTFSQKVDDDLLEMMVGGVRRCRDDDQARRFPEAFIDSLMALAYLECFPSDLLKFAFSDEYTRGIPDSVIKDKNSQLLLLHHTVALECSYSTSSGFSQEFLSKIPPGKYGNIEHELLKRVGLSALYESLQDLLKTSHTVKCRYIIPEFHMADIEICVNSSEQVPTSQCDTDQTEALNICPPGTSIGYRKPDGIVHHQGAAQKSVLQQLMEEERDAVSQSTSLQRSYSHKKEKPMHNVPLSALYPPGEDASSKQTRIAIQVMGWNQYARNANILLGHYEMKLRHLRITGYHVFLVSPIEAGSLHNMEPHHRKQYITENILPPSTTASLAVSKSKQNHRC